MKDIKALLGSKNKLNPLEKEAKLKALKDMRKVAGDMLADGVKSKMQKVTVAAPDTEGLEMGLEKAKDVIKHIPDSEEMESEDMSEMESEDMPEMESEDEIELSELNSVEDIDKLMAKLAEKKAALMKE